MYSSVDFSNVQKNKEASAAGKYTGSEFKRQCQVSSALRPENEDVLNL